MSTKRSSRNTSVDLGTGSLSPLQQYLLTDLTVHMPGSLLDRLDRASIAHSLEAQVPFLSHKFVDWSLTMPLDLKLRGNIGKYSLRRAAEPWLPSDVLKGPKLGFRCPLPNGLSGIEFARGSWNDSGAVDLGFLNSHAVEKIFTEHRNGNANHGHILFAITMLSCWWADEASRSATLVAPAPCAGSYSSNSRPMSSESC